MNFSDLRTGLKLAVAVSGCLIVAGMLSSSVALVSFVFGPAWMVMCPLGCIAACWLYRTRRS